MGILMAFGLQQCRQIGDRQESIPQDLRIHLQWYPAYSDESQQDVEVGLLWILAYLGEPITSNNYLDYMDWVEDDILLLDLTQLVSNPHRVKLWQKILTSLEASSTDRLHHSVDVGKFVFSTFNESETYYKLTEMPDQLEEFKTYYNLDENYVFAVAAGESCVAPGYRIFNSSKTSRLPRLGYIAQEGDGESIADFTPNEFEVFGFMKNGQPRFGVYGTDGKLREGGHPDLTTAGKPAKCMWCHTSQVQPLIFASSTVDGYESQDSFTRRINQQNKLRRRYLRKQNLDFVIDSLKQHSLAELLYVTYEYPTPQRLAAEGMTQGQISDFDFHQNVEYRFFGLVFDSMVHRNAIDPTFKRTARETEWSEKILRH